ncbi:uncharacterized protein LOC144861905 [Branchiostoma floridae x Branchiostoma japonicum]
MVVGWLEEERQPPKAAPEASGQPFSGITLPTPKLGKGLEKNNRYLTLISTYAPTLVASDAEKDSFYEALNTAVRAVPHADKLAILGDFNARVGNSHHLWQRVMGVHGVGKCNDNGLRLLSFCAEHDLVITNTLFQLRTMHKTTWMHPRSKRWHMLDYVLVRQLDRKDVKITRVMRGAQGWTDHRMVRTRLEIHIKKHARKNAHAGKLNTRALEDSGKREELQTALASRLTHALEDLTADTELLTTAWEAVASTLNTTARQVLGTTTKRNRDWFDEQREDIHTLLREQHSAHAAVLRSPSPANRARLAEVRSQAQREIRKMKNEWWTRLATEIQGYADKGNQQQFYCALKAAYGPRRGSVLSVTGDITDEVQRRIGLASSSFGRLASRVFLNKDLTIKTKVAVYKAICLSILLYASEAWTPYRRHIRMLEQFHTRCLQRILGLKWWHKVPHAEIRRRADIEPLETLLLQRQLRWAGHVIRMPGNRLPRHMLYGELTKGKRTVGGQHKRFKDNLKANLKKCGIPPQGLETSAADRNRWRQECAAGAARFTASFNQQYEERRRRRHLPTSNTSTSSNHICEECGRTCKSRIGLTSHQRTHAVNRT